MESKENGKYKGKNINYHNLGIDGLESALHSFDNPDYVLLSTRESKIELILSGKDYKNRQLFSIVEVNTEARNNFGFLKAHVVTSVYGKRNIKNHIIKAQSEGRLIYNKNEEASQGIPPVQYQSNINDNSSFKSSISQNNQYSQEQNSDRDLSYMDAVNNGDMEKADYQKKKSSETLLTETRSASTKSASRSNSKDIIAQEDAKSQVQNSDRDNLGNTLTEAQQEFFKDSKVRDADGNLLVCYHGTDAEFDVFDTAFISRDNKLGYGFYFMAGKELQFKYKNPLKVYLNIVNPITDTSKNLSGEKVTKFCDKLGIGFEYDETEGDLGIYERLCDSYTGEIKPFLKHALDVLGVDGVLSEERNVAVSFSSEQIKLTTNTNPSANDDIRYSDRVIAEGMSEEKRGLERVYVLFSALNDGGEIIPIQFEVEQYRNEENRLYLAVALTKIETGVKGNTAPDEQKATSLLPISNISIAEIFAKINPSDKNLLKYIPNQFLNDEQIGAKEVALDIDREKYSNPSNDGIQNSDRITESVYDTMGETERLRKDNARLKKDLANLKERLSIEGKVTGGTAVLSKDTDVIARHVRKIADSTFDTDKLSAEFITI